MLRSASNAALTAIGPGASVPLAALISDEAPIVPHPTARPLCLTFVVPGGGEDQRAGRTLEEALSSSDERSTQCHTQSERPLTPRAPARLTAGRCFGLASPESA